MTEDYPAVLGRNAFEADNARNQYERQLPRTFVPTKIYWRMFAEKNQLLVGTRGSGKTAILKMLTLPYLQHFADDDAKALVLSRRFIGIYIPVSTLWLGPIKSKQWSIPGEKEREFVWRFSIAACQALTKTIEAALELYSKDTANRLSSLAVLIGSLSKLWFNQEYLPGVQSMEDLRDRLGELPLEKNLHDASRELNALMEAIGPFNQGLRFYSPVLDSFIHGIRAVEREFGFSNEDTSWFICLDEVEALDTDLQIIVNTFMRSDFGNKYFKIATLPYSHKTLKTQLHSNLQPGHDFEYLWIDDDPATQENTLRGAVSDYSSWTFARALYNKRRQSSIGILVNTSLDRLLGKQSILSPVDLITSSTRNNSSDIILRTFETLGERHFNEFALERSRKMLGALRYQSDKDVTISGFGDQMLRKTLGFLLLRDALSSRMGGQKLQAYSGAEMLVRIADGNARTLIRLLNAMLRSPGWRDSRSAPLIPRTLQHSTHTAFSQTVLNRTKSEEEHGPALFLLLDRIGKGLARLFRGGRVGSDLVGQVQFDPQQFALHRGPIELGVQLGLLRVDVRPGSEFVLPTDGGTFRLSYVLSPTFELMPRRGRRGALQTIIGASTIEQPNFNFGTTA